MQLYTVNINKCLWSSFSTTSCSLIEPLGMSPQYPLIMINYCCSSSLLTADRKHMIFSLIVVTAGKIRPYTASSVVKTPMATRTFTAGQHSIVLLLTTFPSLPTIWCCGGHNWRPSLLMGGHHCTLLASIIGKHV